MLAQQVDLPLEVVIVCPSPAVADLAAKHTTRERPVRHVQDDLRGKPAAVGLGMDKATGDVYVLTDDDVIIPDDRALARLLAHFRDPKVGAVTGRPRALNPGDTRTGFWAQVLFEQAHVLRERTIRRRGVIDCSGALYAVRASFAPPVIPARCLAEDAFISGEVARAEGLVQYEPSAIAFVIAPRTIVEWWRQKLRTLRGARQCAAGRSNAMRSFLQELRSTGAVLRSAKDPQELSWAVQLLIARGVVWLKIQREPREDLWDDEGLWADLPTTKPTVHRGAVFCVSDAVLGRPTGKCRPCLILADDGAGNALLVARTTHPTRRSRAIPSALADPAFDKPGWFIPVVHSVPIDELGNYRGECAGAEVRSVFEGVR